MKHSKEELKDLLLEKNTSDIYSVTLSPVVLDKENIEKIKEVSPFAGFLARLAGPNAPITLGAIKKGAMLTLVDGEYYDVQGNEYVDLEKYRVLRFAKFSDLFTEDEAKVKYFDESCVGEAPSRINTVSIDFRDEEVLARYISYDDEGLYLREYEDVTEEFIKATKSNLMQLKQEKQ